MFDFDTIIDRRATYSTKWEASEQDSNAAAANEVLPFWIADMDFAAPPFIQRALQQRLDHGVHGYTNAPPLLTELVIEWLSKHCAYTPHSEQARWLPGVVPGLNLAAMACALPGGCIAIPTPVYYPFLNVPRNARQGMLALPLVLDRNRWVMDFDEMARLIDGHHATVTSLLLSNPQNPTGRVYEPRELVALAEFCLARGITIISDEIHSPLIIDPTHSHRSVAGLAPEVARQCITLHAASKAYNTAGLNAAVAIIADADLRRRFDGVERGLLSAISPFAYAVAEAAYADRSPYLPELCRYLAVNHRRLFDAVNHQTPAHMTPVEATYLGWIDIRALDIEQPDAHFLRHGLRLNNGADFGAPGFVRFNFAAPQALVAQGIERLVTALSETPACS